MLLHRGLADFLMVDGQPMYRRVWAMHGPQLALPLPASLKHAEACRTNSWCAENIDLHGSVCVCVCVCVCAFFVFVDQGCISIF